MQSEIVCAVSFWGIEHNQTTVKPLILVTLNFGILVNLIILDPVILAFLLPTTLKSYCIQIFANLPGSRNKGHAKKNGYSIFCKKTRSEPTEQYGSWLTTTL